MTVITAEHVAIAELVVYILTALATLFVVLRHGFHKQLGWIYLYIFCVIRVVGAVLQILSHNDPSNTNDLEWATILQSVGLSPLLLASLGLLKRICDETTRRVPSSNNNQFMQTFGPSGGLAGKPRNLLQKSNGRVTPQPHHPAHPHPPVIALVLAIIGGTDQASSNVSDHKDGRTETRAAITLFLFIYLALGLLWLITARDLGVMVGAQRRIYFALFLALPPIAVRLLYSLLGDFGHHPKFSVRDGSVSVRLWMATLEEFVVVLLYTIVGIFTPRGTVQVSWPVPGSERPVQGSPRYEPMGYMEAGPQRR
ncbi:hypothetical protein BJY01DRAFT_253790 [Aspergillus pseudoustus]|uniref:DUF7702 domain-containing protein n=1 Tax=Aspergillus pseudoustus TaxID=1810923 RepID=A0ABR4IYP8_9EURO